jgi:hypothetical protein
MKASDGQDSVDLPAHLYLYGPHRKWMPIDAVSRFDEKRPGV